MSEIIFVIVDLLQHEISNAALNILNEGIDQLIRAGTAQIYAYGDVTSGEVVFNNTSSYTSLKQEATQALA